MRTVLLGSVFLLLPTFALARNVEPGSTWLSGGLGADVKLASPLAGSDAHFLVLAQGEYALDKTLGIVGGMALGVAGSWSWRARAGMRYRFADLGLPISPWGQAQLSFGQVRGVLGANLWTVGAAVAAGADYFLTAELSVGGSLGLDLSSTLGSRPAFYGTFEILAVVSYAWSIGTPAPTLEEG